MPSLLDRARSLRHHDNTALRSTIPEDHPANPDVPAPAVPAPAVSDPAAPNPATSEADPPPSSAISERESETTPAPIPAKTARTRISGTWVASIVAVVALIFLLIFILQNLAGTHVYFLGAAGSLPMGVAMLFAAVAGALLIALIGSARVLQLRRAARRRHH
jgi:uncharacterized integral membrane protein